MWKKIVLWVLALLLITSLCPLPGLASSWGQINQPIGSPQGWRRIVENSPFALGERHTVEAPDGLAFVEVGFGSYPSIDGSTVAVPMVMEFARQHLGLSEQDLPFFAALSTTHTAYENLIGKRPNGAAQLASEGAVMDGAHPVDLLIATEPSEEELALAEASGVELVKKPVCHDAFVFIVHASNPVSSLTVEQIRGIYGGEITDWQQVGGEPGEIDAYARNRNSGSQTAMENIVMQGRPIVGTAAYGFRESEMSSLVFAIGGGYGDSSQGIGYTYKYYIDELYRDDAIKVLAIDGIDPSPENVRSGAYPFSTSYFGVIRKGEEAGAGGLFLAWMLTEQGQLCVLQAGYIPVMQITGETGGK